MIDEKRVFRLFCVSQLHRLGVFREFEFKPATVLKEYRRWLEAQCGTEERVRKIMDAAVELERMPTIADLIRLKATVFPPPEVESSSLTAEERRDYIRRWYEQADRDAEKRRQAAVAAEAARRTVPPPNRFRASADSILRITDEDVSAMREEQERRRAGGK